MSLEFDSEIQLGHYSLRNKVLGVMLLLIAIALSVSVILMSRAERQLMEEQVHAQGQLIANASAVNVIEPMLVNDYPVLETYCTELISKLDDLLYIEIYREDGQLVASSYRELDLMRKRKVNHKREQQIENSNIYRSLVIADYESEDGNGTTLGEIKVELSLDRYEQLIDHHIVLLVTQFSLVFLVLALFLFVSFRRILIDPIHELASFAGELGSGNLDKPISSKGSGELLVVANILELMRINLKQSYDEIKERNHQLDCRIRERTTTLEATSSELDFVQQQLLQSEKMSAIGQLSAGIAHEINNPIGYVNSNISILDEWFINLLKLIEAYEERADGFLSPGSSEWRELEELKELLELSYIREDIPNLMKDTMEGLSRVIAIVKDLKEFSRSSDGAWEKVDIHSGLDSTINIAMGNIKQNSQVIREYGDLPNIECIPSQLNQVFMNIIVNAIQATKGSVKGVITIRTYADSGFVYIAVEDTGCGISAEQLNRIFEPFYTTKEVGEGTGLGLSVSYGIIVGHNGRIEVVSDVGEGTTFIIILPVVRDCS